MAKTTYLKADFEALAETIYNKTCKSREQRLKKYRESIDTFEQAERILETVKDLPVWFTKSNALPDSIEKVIDQMEEEMFELPQIVSRRMLEFQIRAYLLKGGDITKVEEVIKGEEE